MRVSNGRKSQNVLKVGFSISYYEVYLNMEDTEVLSMTMKHIAWNTGFGETRTNTGSAVGRPTCFRVCVRACVSATMKV